VRGRYVAVPGPQFETAAEARWLAGYGDVVGMSTALEVRTARERGLETTVLALVVNRSGATGREVLRSAIDGRRGRGARDL
jgi:purine nucleoside phosphorylase